ncbi:MAG TPA: hypothetical protein H9674_09730 [Firmicutes bacterium]|nr:hypothetical protein [Bacillota bacterium]
MSTIPKTIGKTTLSVLACGLLLVISSGAQQIIRHHANFVADSVENSLDQMQDRRREKRDVA